MLMLRTGYYGIGDGLGDLVPRSESPGGTGGDYTCNTMRRGGGWVCVETASHAERWFLRMQTALAALYGVLHDSAYDPGPADGFVGPKTANAAQLAVRRLNTTRYPDARVGVLTPDEEGTIAYIDAAAQSIRVNAVSRKADVLAVYFEKWLGALVQRTPSGAPAESVVAAQASRFRAAAVESANDAQRGAAEAIQRGSEQSERLTTRNAGREAFYALASNVQTAAGEVTAAADEAEATGEEVAVAPPPAPATELPATVPEDLPPPAAEEEGGFPWGWVLGGLAVAGAAVGGTVLYKRRQSAVSGVG